MRNYLLFLLVVSLRIGSNGEGVQRISRNKIVEHISVDSGLPSNSIRCFTEDRYGNIWVGTASGLAYINHEHKIVIPVYDNGKDVSHVIIKMLYCETADRIWMFLVIMCHLVLLRIKMVHFGLLLTMKV